MANQIETLEGQLSQRSRIVMSRRPSSRSGPRKVDEMQEKLSKLRQGHVQETESADDFGKQLSQLENTAEQVLFNCYEQCRGLKLAN